MPSWLSFSLHFLIYTANKMIAVKSRWIGVFILGELIKKNMFSHLVAWQLSFLSSQRIQYFYNSKLQFDHLSKVAHKIYIYANNICILQTQRFQFSCTWKCNAIYIRYSGQVMDPYDSAYMACYCCFHIIIFFIVTRSLHYPRTNKIYKW